MAGRWKVEWLALTEGGERIVPGLKFLSEIETSPRNLSSRMGHG